MKNHRFDQATLVPLMPADARAVILRCFAEAPCFCRFREPDWLADQNETSLPRLRHPDGLACQPPGRSMAYLEQCPPRALN